MSLAGSLAALILWADDGGKLELPRTTQRLPPTPPPTPFHRQDERRRRRRQRHSIPVRPPVPERIFLDRRWPIRRRRRRRRR